MLRGGGVRGCGHSAEEELAHDFVTAAAATFELQLSWQLPFWDYSPR